MLCNDDTALDRVLASSAASDMSSEPDIRSGLSLLFAPGSRPPVEEIEARLSPGVLTVPRAQITNLSSGTLELLASGLAFELIGLAPAPATQLPEINRRFGMADHVDLTDCEAITLVPGSHIAAGCAMIPLVRAMMGLAADLALALPAKAIVWHPSGSLMDTVYFTRVIVSWLSGGPFPSSGLTTIEELAGGGAVSRGLRFFAGQEILVEPFTGDASGETARLAAIVVNHVIRHGRITGLQELSGPEGETMVVEPSFDGHQVRVWRTA
jgi:hypothetical protein